MHQIIRMMDHHHDHTEDAAPASSFRELMERRDRLNGWLSRLDEETGANPAVVQRIRDDYEAQLDAIMGELAGHYDTLCTQRSELDDEVERARREREAARDALEEAELRHRIGEYDDGEWESRRSELQPPVDAASAELDELLRRTEELDQVIAELREGLGPDRTEPLPQLQADSHYPSHDPDEAQETDEADETREYIEHHEAHESEAAGAVVDSVEETLEHGREESSPPAAAADGDDGLPEENGATRPSPGVKCAECGYTNDYGALFCGVCGVDLA